MCGVVEFEFGLFEIFVVVVVVWKFSDDVVDVFEYEWEYFCYVIEQCDVWKVCREDLFVVGVAFYYEFYVVVGLLEIEIEVFDFGEQGCYVKIYYFCCVVMC